MRATASHPDAMAPETAESTELEEAEMTLSHRQTEIVSLVADGLSSKEIARKLVISPKTVESHLQRLFDRYRVRTRAALVARWVAAQTGGTERFVLNR
ncbi:MAG: response regulator transcription factor [Pseudonocardiaceae bacterium]